MKRTQTMSPIQDGGNSNDHSGKPTKVQVKSKMSAERMGGVKDPLMQSFGGHPPAFRNSDIHVHIHSGNVQSGGATYEPRQEYGSIKGKATPATSLGKAMSKVGGKGSFRGKP